MINFKNCYKHFITILKHKYYVFFACRDCGIVWRGIIHDISKFTPSEFFEYAKYYQEGRSPVDVAKEKHGFSKSWLKHKGRNSHHSLYWFDLDISDNTVKPLKMPYNDVVEMICDWVGASKAYGKEKWTEESNWIWYKNNKEKIILHPDTREMVENILLNMKASGWESVSFALKHNRFKT